MRDRLDAIARDLASRPGCWAPRRGMVCGRRVRWRLGASILIAASIAGCVFSKEPLFPTGSFIARTPIAPGYFLKTTVVEMDGVRRTSIIPVPVSIQRDDADYQLITARGDGGLERQPFQVFGLSTDRIQVIQGVNLTGSGPGGWFYRTLVVDERGRLAVGFRHCNTQSSSIDPAFRTDAIVKGLIREATTSACAVDNAVALRTLLFDDAAWRHDTIEIFEPVDAGSVVSLRSLREAPVFSVRCIPPRADQEEGRRTPPPRPAAAEGSMRAIASSAAAHPRVLAIEVVGGRDGHWATIRFERLGRTRP